MGQIPIYGTKKKGMRLHPFKMARPERFELPTARFVAEYSIQLSYGRLVFSVAGGARAYKFKMAEREGFEPSKGY